MTITAMKKKVLVGLDGVDMDDDAESEPVDCVQTRNFRAQISWPATGTPVGNFRVLGSENGEDFEVQTLTSDMLPHLTACTLESDGTVLTTGAAGKLMINILDAWGDMKVDWVHSSGSSTGVMSAATGKRGE
jgi:hypothetical protein|tara:strand:+ start:2063 stop:2458 length:396 start_codon:yes stop_codon:yes gene_type:complete